MSVVSSLVVVGIRWSLVIGPLRIVFVKMDYLRSLFEAMDFSNVEIFIASGNVIFRSNYNDTRALKESINKHLQQFLGYEVTTFIRTDREVVNITTHKPFPKSELQSAGALNIAFLAAPLTNDAIASLNTLKTTIDDFHTHAREVYWLCKSESTFSNAVFEKTLKLKATFRGANTVSRIAAKYSANL
jgi:uncharacterized protein (DUF1697 family)